MTRWPEPRKGGELTECYVIAEAGLNHNGSVAVATALIDMAAAAGADAVKFQKRTVEKLAIRSVLDARDDRFPEFGTTYRQIREHLELSMEDYRTLKAHAEARGLDFIVTAFDENAVDFLEALDVQRYKLASHCATNLPLLRYVARLGKPTILSTGMTDLDDVDRAVDTLSGSGAPLVLLHCVSSYPTPPDECNLAMIDVLKARYGLPVGYSGHEMGYLPTVLAVAVGAQMVERHITLDKSMVGFDHRISLEPDELTAMVRDIRSVRRIRGAGEKRVTESESVTRRKYQVSLVSAVEIPVGTTVAESMFTYRNPGTGIPPKLAHTVVGRRARRDVAADELLTIDMFE